MVSSNSRDPHTGSIMNDAEQALGCKYGTQDLKKNPVKLCRAPQGDIPQTLVKYDERIMYSETFG